MIDYLILISFIIFTIVIHELGHFIAALICKVNVNIVSLGFGKILLKKKIKDTLFCISAIPLGGYCELKGEKTKAINGFLALPYRKKLFILLAGVGANLIVLLFCYIMNTPQNILIGFVVDWQVVKFIFSKSKDIIEISAPYPILVQLSLINFLTIIANILPLPCLDGGQCIYIWLEKCFTEEKFVKIYGQLNYWGFWIVNWLQVYILFWYWIK